MGTEPGAGFRLGLLGPLFLRWVQTAACAGGGTGGEAFPPEIRMQALSDAACAVDATLLDLRGTEAGAAARLRAACGATAPFGCIYAAGALDALGGALDEAGLRRFAAWTWSAEAGFGYVPPGEALPHGAFGVVLAVRRDYDPSEHARALIKQGHPGWAMELLENVPDAFLPDDRARAMVATDKLTCLLLWDKAAGPKGRLNRLARARDEFYKATTWLPGYPLAYLLQAMFWDRFGAPEMGLRQLRTFQHVGNSAEAAALAGELAARAGEPASAPTIAPPAWSGKPWKILFLVPKNPDYGADVLYDGLCAVLDEDNVVDFPWKPTLHGRVEGELVSYPCYFERPGEAWAIEAVEAALRAGEFDAVFYADTLRLMPRELVRRVMASVGDCPLFLLDLWDQCGDYRADMLEYLGRDAAAGVFKREMLQYGVYAPCTFPMPFGYPASRALEAPDAGETRSGLFWAGQPQYGARRLTLEYLRTQYGIDPHARFSQEQYAAALRRAAIGLCLFGNGFDTVRYWEIPAHGAMLLAERPPILLPHDFQDGESAVFFDDLPELEEKLAYYAARPEEAAAIARAGHAHYRAHHTAAARARHLLGWMESALRGETPPEISRHWAVLA